MTLCTFVCRSHWLLMPSPYLCMCVCVAVIPSRGFVRLQSFSPSLAHILLPLNLRLDFTTLTPTQNSNPQHTLVHAFPGLQSDDLLSHTPSCRNSRTEFVSLASFLSVSPCDPHLDLGVCRLRLRQLHRDGWNRSCSLWRDRWTA